MNSTLTKKVKLLRRNVRIPGDLTLNRLQHFPDTRAERYGFVSPLGNTAHNTLITSRTKIKKKNSRFNSWPFPEKLIVAQLLKKFCAFHETQGSLACQQQSATGLGRIKLSTSSLSH
jgi:hypothetical protein